MFEFELPPGFLDGEPPSWYTVIRSASLRAAPYDGTPRPAPEGAEPRVLVLEAGGESDVFVSEYAENLGYITDSWFPTREAAVSDLTLRFGDELGPWLPVPATEGHAENYVLRVVSAPIA